MNNFTIELNNVTKYFGRLLVFNKINYSFSSGTVYGISGKNGSGKSTISKIICGVNSASRGEIKYVLNNNVITHDKVYSHVGFVAPYLVLYGEFTAFENLRYFADIRGNEFKEETAKHWLSEFQLYKRRNDLLKGFSSGMQQRMKFIFALMHNPDFFILDEPTSNLDVAGKDKVYEIVENLSKEKLIIIASNEKSDLEICSEFLNVENYKVVK